MTSYAIHAAVVGRGRAANVRGWLGHDGQAICAVGRPGRAPSAGRVFRSQMWSGSASGGVTERFPTPVTKGCRGGAGQRLRASELGRHLRPRCGWIFRAWRMREALHAGVWACCARDRGEARPRDSPVLFAHGDAATGGAVRPYGLVESFLVDQIGRQPSQAQTACAEIEL